MNKDLGYNSESGGSLNKHMSEQAKEKMRIAKIGKYDGENNPMYGVSVPWTEERRKKLSEMMSGENNPMYGKHVELTEEQPVAVHLLVQQLDSGRRSQVGILPCT